MSGSGAITVEGLVKRYGRLTALDDVSFSVPGGSIYGFLGPNGAGKTTALRILATLLMPTEGKAWVAGEDVARHPARARRQMGYMPDFFGVYDDLTVREYMEFYAQAHGVPRAQWHKIIADLLELVDLGHKRDDFVETLSRGMKQRLGLARCLVHDPEVLLLDEPASGLDPRARVEMREVLREISRMGKAVLISSHILPELEDLSTEVGIIHQGRMVASGPCRAFSLNSEPAGCSRFGHWKGRLRPVTLWADSPASATSRSCTSGVWCVPPLRAMTPDRRPFWRPSWRPGYPWSASTPYKAWKSCSWP